MSLKKEKNLSGFKFIRQYQIKKIGKKTREPVCINGKIIQWNGSEWIKLLNDPDNHF